MWNATHFIGILTRWVSLKDIDNISNGSGTHDIRDSHTKNYDHFEGRKEGNVLFNDALNTFYLRLYGVRHMVKDHSDIERKPAAATCATFSD